MANKTIHMTALNRLTNFQATIEQFQQLCIESMAHAYSAILQLPAGKQPKVYEMLTQLTEAETQHRQQGKSQLYLTLSKLRFDALLPEINCSSERNLDQARSNSLNFYVFSARVYSYI